MTNSKKEHERRANAKLKKEAYEKKKRRKDIRNKVILGTLGIALIVSMVLPYAIGFM